MPGSSLGIARRSNFAPTPPECASSGKAFERPPAPTSWIDRIGFASPRRAHPSITSWQRRSSSAFALAVVRFPRHLAAGDVQVRDREAGEARLGLAGDAGRALVADLAAGAGARARMRRDRGRVVVRLDLHQDVREVAVVSPRAGA